MRLFHYCSNTALVSIIESREIWLSELPLSGDEPEGKWVRRIFSDCCERRRTERQVLDDLMARLDGLMAVFGATGFCLSEEADLLSQWRGYADEGAGVSIGFESVYLEELSNRQSENKFGLSLQKVEYDESCQKEKICCEVDKILQHVNEGALDCGVYSILSRYSDVEKNNHQQSFNRFLFEILYLLPSLYALKSPVFREEKEWRLVSALNKGHEDEELGMLSKTKYRARGDKIIPYLPVELPEIDMPAIREIIIGPSNATPLQVVHGLLKKNGFDGVSVRRSSAS